MRAKPSPSAAAVSEKLRFVVDDGGRAAAGFKGDAGDCVTRAIAIASGRPYREVYDELFTLGRQKWEGTLTGKELTRAASPRDGIFPKVYKQHLDRYGWIWTPTMNIGEGCSVHVRADELPTEGRHILRLSKHLTALVDGTIHDTHDPSREGTRCVYGYWTHPG